MYYIHYTNPNIKGIIPVELTLTSGHTAYVVSVDSIPPEITFETVEEYHSWMSENVDGFGEYK